MSFDKYLLLAIPVIVMAFAYWKFGIIRNPANTHPWVRDFLVSRDKKWHVVFPNDQGMMVTVKTFPEVEYQKAVSFVLKQGKAGLRMMVRSGAMNRKSSTKKQKRK